MATVNEVAEALNRCAVAECHGCEFRQDSGAGMEGMAICQAHLIAKMAVEVRQIAEERRND